MYRSNQPHLRVRWSYSGAESVVNVEGPDIAMGLELYLQLVSWTELCKVNHSDGNGICLFPPSLHRI